VTRDATEAAGYVKSGAAALVYVDDVNGSFERIAGLQDETGRVFGLMPHPERFMKARDHYDPDWDGGEDGWGSGYYLFKSLFQAIKEGEAGEP
jgi:phosphoribosylformylglycinamidine synthase